MYKENMFLYVIICGHKTHCLVKKNHCLVSYKPKANGAEIGLDVGGF